MARYHVSEDGTPRVCSAQSPESCTARGVDGEAAPHGDFSDAGEARRFAESVLESSFGDQKSVSRGSKDSSTSAREPLPSLSGLYGEAPRVNIGMAQTYGNLNGIQRDLDDGYIDEQEARSRIAAVTADLKQLEEYNSTAQRPDAVAFRERLEGLAGGAEPSERFIDQPQWKAVAAALTDHLSSKKPSAKEDRPYEFLLNHIGEGKSGYDGFSISKAVELSRNLEKTTARSRKPELVALHRRLTEATANPVSSSSSAPVEDRRAFSTDMSDGSEYRVEGGKLKANFEGDEYDLGTLREVPREEFDSWNREVFGGAVKFQDGEVFPVHLEDGSEDGAFARFGDRYYRAGTGTDYFKA